jgi:hypothetical protein
MVPNLGDLVIYEDGRRSELSVFPWKLLMVFESYAPALAAGEQLAKEQRVDLWHTPDLAGFARLRRHRE